uniref:Uncharacterized protein n=1 Tax=Glossina palpalis gambiensis TaxID=67801 RepID=A0A1B0B264_9MUSC
MLRHRRFEYVVNSVKRLVRLYFRKGRIQVFAGEDPLQPVDSSPLRKWHLPLRLCSEELRILRAVHKSVSGYSGNLLANNLITLITQDIEFFELPIIDLQIDLSLRSTTATHDMDNENANRIEHIAEENFENSDYFNSFFDT